MVRRGFIDAVAEELPQAQGVGRPPGDPAFAVQSFEETHQHEPEIDAGHQRRPTDTVGIKRFARLFTELVESGLLQLLFQLSVERMSRRLGRYHSASCRSRCFRRPMAMTDCTPKHSTHEMILDT